MRKLLFLTWMGLSIPSLTAQEVVFANETHTMTLFFPSPIRQAITGNGNFTFSYNRENGQHFGLLQGNRGGNSNLLVITQDGLVYSYQLSYRKQLLESHRFVKISESIGSETKTKALPIPIEQEINRPMAEPLVPDLNMLKKGAEYVLGKKSAFLKIKRHKGIVLRFNELFYHGNKVYLEVEVRNNSAIDFDMDALEVYRVNGKRGRRSSYQMVALRPIHVHEMPQKVITGNSHRFVLVVPKFTLGDSEKLLFELHEKNGNRMVGLSWN